MVAANSHFEFLTHFDFSCALDRPVYGEYFDYNIVHHVFEAEFVLMK